MPDVGLEFNASSFNEFNKTLKKFNKIAKTVDKNLENIAKSLGKVGKASENAVSSVARIIKFFDELEKFDLNSTALDKFSKSMQKISRIFNNNRAARNLRDFGEGLNNLVKAGRQLNKLEGDLNDLAKSFGEISQTGGRVNAVRKILSSLSGIKIGNNTNFSRLIGNLSKLFSSIDPGVAQTFQKISGSIRDLTNALLRLDVSGSNLRELSRLLQLSSGPFDRFFQIIGRGSGLKRQLRQFSDAFNVISDDKARSLRTFSLGLNNLITSLLLLRDSGSSLRDLSRFLQTDARIFGRFRPSLTRALGNLIKAFNSLPPNQGQNIRGFADGLSTLADVSIRLQRLGESLGSLSKFLNPNQGLFRRGLRRKVNQLVKAFKGISPEIARSLNEFSIGLTNFIQNLGKISIDDGTVQQIQENIKKLVSAFRSIGKIRIKRANTQSIVSLIQAFSKINNIDTNGINSISKVTKSLNNLDNIKLPTNFATNIVNVFDFGGITNIVGQSISAFTGVLTTGFRTIDSAVRGGLAIINRAFRFATRGFVNAISSFGDSVLRAVRQTLPEISRQVGRGFEEVARTATEAADRAVQRGLTNITQGGLVGLITSGIVSRPVLAAADFEEQFTQVLRTLPLDDLGEEEAAEFIEGFGDELRNLASAAESPLSALENSLEKVTGIAALAGQLGVAREDLVQFTEVVGQLGVASNLTTESAANFLARFDAITGLGGENFDNLASSIVALGNNFATTEDAIAAFSLRIAGIANTLGLAAQDVAGFSAAFSAVGLEPEAAGTAFTQLGNDILGFVNTSDAAFSDFLSNTGRDIGDFSNLLEENAGDALAEFFSAFDELSSAEQLQAFENLGISSVRQQDLIRRLSGNVEGLNEALAISRENYDDLGDSVDTFNALQQEAATQANTTRSAMRRLSNIFNDLLVSVGGALLPAFNEFLQGLSQASEGVKNFIDANPESAGEIIRAITQAAFLAVGVWTLFAGVLQTLAGVILGPFARATLAFGRFISLIGFLITNPFALIGAFAAATPIILGFSAVIAGLTFLFQDLVVNGDRVASAFTRFTRVFNGLISASFNLVTSFANLVSAILGVAPAAERGFSPLASLLDGASALVSQLTKRIQEVADTFQALSLIIGGSPVTSSSGITAEGEQQVNALLEERESILERINELQSETIGQTFEFGSGEGQFSNAFELANELGVSLDELARRAGFDEYSDLADELIGGTSSITIDGDTSGATDEISNLTRELELLDDEISSVQRLETIELPGLEETIANLVDNNQIFANIFGNDTDTAIANAEKAVNGLVNAAQRFRGGVNTLLSSLGDLVSGDFQGALANIHEGFTEISGAISDAVSSFNFSNSATSNLDASGLVTFQAEGGSTGLSDQILTYIRKQVEEIRSLNTDDISQLIANNVALIIQAGFVAIGTILGGPGFAVGIGLVSLIVNAVATDFLGIRTALEESGLSGTIQNGLTEFFSGLNIDLNFSGDSFGAVNSFTDALNENFGSENQSFLDKIAPSFDRIINAVQRLLKIDISGLVTIFTDIGEIVAVTGLNVFSRIIDAISVSIEVFADAANDFADGDASGGIKVLTDALTSLKETALSFSANIFDNIVKAIESVVDIDLPDSQEVIDFIEEFKETIDNFLNNPIFGGEGGASILSVVQDTLDNIVSAIGGFIKGLRDRDLEGFKEIFNGFVTGLAVSFGFIGFALNIASVVLEEVLPLIGNLLGDFIDTLSSLTDNDIGTAIGGFIGVGVGIIAAAKLIVSGVGLLSGAITTIASFIPLVNSILGAVATAFATVTAPFIGIATTIISGISTALSKLASTKIGTLLTGVPGAIAAGIAAGFIGFNLLEEAGIITDVRTFLFGSEEGFNEFQQQAEEAFFEFITGAIEGIGDLAEGAVSIAEAIGPLIVEGISKIGDFLGDADLSGVVNVIGDGLALAVEGASGILTGALQGFANTFKLELLRIEIEVNRFLLSVEQRLAEAANTFRGLGFDVEAAEGNVEAREAALEALRFEESLLSGDVTEVSIPALLNLDFSDTDIDALVTSINSDLASLVGKIDFTEGQEEIGQQLSDNFNELLSEGISSGNFELEELQAIIDLSDLIGFEGFDDFQEELQRQLDLSAVSGDFEFGQQILDVANIIGIDATELQSESSGLAQSFIDGFSAGLEGQDAGEKEKSQEIIDNVKEVFGIESPSTVMMEVGQNLMEGLAEGIAEGVSLIEDQLELIVKATENMALRVDVVLGRVERRWFNFIGQMAGITVQYELIMQTIEASTSNLIGVFDPLITTLQEVASIIGTVIDQFNQLAAVDFNAIVNAASEAAEGIKNVANTTSNSVPGNAIPAFSGAPLNPGKIYEVLENNLPFELVRTTNQTFLLSNTSGSIVSPATAPTISGSNANNVTLGSGGPMTNNVQQTINVPVTFDTIGSDVSDEQLERISDAVSTQVKEKIELEEKRNTLTDRLIRSGRL